MVRAEFIVTTIPCATIKSTFCFCPNANVQTANRIETIPSIFIDSLNSSTLSALGTSLSSVLNAFDVVPASRRLNLHLLSSRNLRIRHRFAAKHAEVLHALQCESWSAGNLHSSKCRVFDILEHDRGARICIRGFNLHALHLQATRVPNKDPVCRSRSKHVWLRILLLLFRHLQLSIGTRTSAAIHENDVTDLHVLNRVFGNSSKNARNLRRSFCLHASDSAQDQAPNRSNRNATGSTHSRPQPDEDRGLVHVAHCDIRAGHVLNDSAIDALNRKAAASIKNTIAYRNVLETAVRFGSEFDSPGARNFLLCRKFLPATIERRAFLVVARKHAIGNCDHFRCP